MAIFNKYDKLPIHLKDEKARPVHWLLLIVCVAFYLAFYAVIIYLSGLQQDMAFPHINKYTLNGVLAQGQVISVILLTLNPLKGSRLTALVLCGLTSGVSLITVLFGNSTDALPGIFVPMTSGAISIIISNYSQRLKNQLKRVLDYSRIVKRNEEMLHALAYYDTLTGLPNKKTLTDQIDMLQKNESCFYLVYIDINNFKKINDAVGHSIGDAVLETVAQRWKRHCRNEDLLARAGGDEFIVLVCHDTDKKQLAEYLKGFNNVLKEPVRIENKDFYIKASLGVVRSPDDGETTQELLKNADIALSESKKVQNYQFFSKAIKEEISRKIRLESDLFSAIGNNELFVVYQPQYFCGSLELRGFEALIRWKHPELGVIGPVEFIPIAEESGIMNDIGQWVMESVLGTFIKLRESAGINTIVSVNISVKQLLDPAFTGMVCSVLKKTGFDCRYLEFEFAESVFAVSPENVTDVLNQLKSMGIGIAIDDFGKRFASLSDLQGLPINILKIDKALVDKTAPSDQMTGAIISLAHRLGFEVVAEGVEQPQQMDYLRTHQCDYAQGYYLSKPVVAEQIDQIYYQNVKSS